MNVYEVITQRIIDKLESGTVPWHIPWNGGQDGMPRNLSSGKDYRGINVFMLAMSGFASPNWLTFRQAKALGGSVKKGEKGYPVLFWNWREKEEQDKSGKAKTRRAPIVRYYTVFNLAQCEGIDDPKGASEDLDVIEFSPISKCEAIVRNMPNAPEIEHKQQRAFYRPSTDAVNLPVPSSFDSVENYYSTLFHELTHATGHETRLGRPGVVDTVSFGSHDYSKEELVAEMGAAFLCGEGGIDAATIDDHAAYIQGWLSKLKDDSRLVVQAAAQAQKAADYVLARDFSGAAQ